MNTLLKSVLISTIATAPLAYYAVDSSVASIAGSDIPKTLQPSLMDFAQLANDYVFDLKVQAGVVPAPPTM